MPPKSKINEGASDPAGKQRLPASPTSMTGQRTQPSQPQPSPYAPAAPPSTNAPSRQDSTQPQTKFKVAIPRLNRNRDDQSPSIGPVAAEKNRVAHACEPCRRRKTKCSGERPRCQHCEDFKLPCTYADGKRDKTKKLVLVESSSSLTDVVTTDSSVVWLRDSKSTSNCLKNLAYVLEIKTRS